MTTTMSRAAFFWTPRVLAMVFIAWVSLFALDVFGEGQGFWKTLSALLIHLVPSYVLIGALVLAWKWPWIGAALFTLCAAGFAVIVRGVWWVKGLFVVPCLLMAFLFLMNWVRREDMG